MSGMRVTMRDGTHDITVKTVRAGLSRGRAFVRHTRRLMRLRGKARRITLRETLHMRISLQSAGRQHRSRDQRAWSRITIYRNTLTITMTINPSLFEQSAVPANESK